MGHDGSTSTTGHDQGGESLRTVLVALAANALIAVAKSVAAVLSGSASMVAEAAHSWADTGNELFLLQAERRAAAPPDPGHPLGFGRAAFVGAMIAGCLLNADAFKPELPIGRNPEAGAAGRHIGTLFVAWLVLAQVLKQRWAGKVLADERDARIAHVAGQWGRGATSACIIGIAMLLGFSDASNFRRALKRWTGKGAEALRR